jgi:hypothetical protein
MRGIPSRTGLATLTEAANAVVPAVVLGLSRSLDDGRVSVLYSYPHGIGEFVLGGSDVPDALLPTAEGPRQADVAAIKANPLGAVEWLLLFGGVQRVVSVRAPDSAPPTRFFIGLSDPDPLTFDQLARLEPLAEASLRVLGAPQSPEDAGERLRRLDLGAGLLPALLRVLDARDVFDRLSVTAKHACPPQ